MIATTSPLIMMFTLSWSDNKYHWHDMLLLSATCIPLDFMFHTTADVMITTTTAEITIMIITTAITHKGKLSPLSADGTVRERYELIHYSISTH